MSVETARTVLLPPGTVTASVPWTEPPALEGVPGERQLAVWAAALTTENVRQSQASAKDVETVSAQVQQICANLAELADVVARRPVVSQTMIYDLGQSPYALRQPLLVTIEEYPDEVIATVPEFALYASAEAPARAIALLKREIASTYAEYEQLGIERLGPPARDHLLTFRQIIQQPHA